MLNGKYTYCRPAGEGQAESSKSPKYSQEVTSTEDEPEREGRSLAATHDEERKGQDPAHQPGEWFEKSDSRGLNFIYQQQRSDGQQSNIFRLENPGREDA
ncbi:MULTISPECIES: hypothetical protein [Micrococcaceae]|uniref:hypothetical protein n=1 Tax=Micrococcaceae TaxID=1268 RepID=UPI0018D251F1|nr:MULTISPECIES: hypothetical protein [unclassified Pseudarthrobacter]MEA3551908.1 hypothetical protein [Pseudarthrobacter sp. C1]